MARRRSRSVFSPNRSRSVFSSGGSGGVGGRFTQFLIIILLAILVAAVMFLGFWDIDPARQPVEKLIPNERLFHDQTVPE